MDSFHYRRICGFFSLLSYAMETIAMGTAYAIWTGIGTAGGALAGILSTASRRMRSASFHCAYLCAAVGLKILS